MLNNFTLIFSEKHSIIKKIAELMLLIIQEHFFKGQKGEDMDATVKKELERVVSLNPDKIIVSNPVSKNYEYIRIEINEIYLDGNKCYHVASYTKTQVFEDNVRNEKLYSLLSDVFPAKLCQINAFTELGELALKMTKSGRLLSNINKKNVKSKSKMISPAQNTHNRQKNYIFREGEVIDPLVDMGIFTREGKVVKSMYDKFRQINRFIELVEDVIVRYGKKEINIVDFGCEKSYLTFLVYHYLVNVRNMKARIVGLDLKTDVIDKCNAAARKYGYDGLHFEVGNIDGYKPDMRVDMVMTLHACDTATDFALINAIEWGAKIIMSVPCCQHEVNRQIACDTLSPIMDYGILKERTAAIVTDAVRGKLLEYYGYNTQILEFVDLAHSPKNLLIRAVKTNKPAEVREKAYAQVKDMCELLSTEPTLYKYAKTQRG